MTTTLWNIPICINLNARNGKPLPSDHSLVVIDIDSPTHPFDAGGPRRIPESRRACKTSNELEDRTGPDAS